MLSNLPSAVPPPMVSPPQAVLLDRDGVINVRRVDHVKGWQEFTFLPGVKSALAKLATLHLPVFIVTNQAVINRGILSLEALEAMHERMCDEVAVAGGAIVGIAYCPHRPDEACHCRKPAPGMLRSLATKYRLDLSRCLMVGDSCSDLLAGKAAGCRTALVLTGQGHEERLRAQSLGLRGYMTASNLAVLVRWIEREFFAPVTYVPNQPIPAPIGAAD
jgi:D-glycero-D-manno-heptose 1,7-bisphosphate phosphatase